jgi:hypothetical protein
VRLDRRLVEDLEAAVGSIPREPSTDERLAMIEARLEQLVHLVGKDRLNL